MCSNPDVLPQRVYLWKRKAFWSPMDDNATVTLPMVVPFGLKEDEQWYKTRVIRATQALFYYTIR